MILAPTLLLNAGSGAAIVRPTFSRDFAGEKTLNNGTGPSITFTRASDATYFDANGTLRFAPNNAIRNSEAGGAAAGTPGTMPTNWAAATSAHGLSREIVGSGTSGGLSYVDIRYSGTTNTASGMGIFFEGAGTTAASSGQTWTTSAYIALVAGSVSGVSTVRPFVEATDGTTRVGSLFAFDVKNSLTSALTRSTATATLTEAGITHVRGGIDFTYATGQVIDLTLRIAAPQLERGPAATAYNPTTGTAFFGPRFDHDPADGSSKGLLIEEARTNLLTYSSDFSNAAWLKNLTVVTADQDTAPDGTATADLIDASSETNGGYPGQLASVTANAFTASVFAKKGTTDFLRMRFDTGGGTSVSAMFDLNAGAAGTPSAGVNSSIQAAGGGWYRCSATYTFAGAASRSIALQPATAIDNFTPTGTLYLWGAQLEAGAFPTSYIPTTSAAVTRSADSAVVTPISSFYNASEGTLFAEAIVRPRAVNIASITQDATEDNRLTLYTATTRTMRWFVNTAGVTEYNSESSAIEDGAVGKIAGAYKSNDVISATNGVLASGDTSITFPSSLTHFFIGRTATTFPPLNGHIRRIAYFPKRLSNALLQSLTT